jgi:hypothetical protein
MPYDAPPELAALSLAEIAEAVAARRLPPVESWQPTETVDSSIRIAADGTWFHEGAPIRRPGMVRAFASLLARGADGHHALLTPQCRQLVAVDDAAFLAVDMAWRADEGGALVFRLNTDELVIAGPEHPLRAAGEVDTPAIYLAVRRGCEARLDRSTWLQLTDHALEHGDGTFVESCGARFALIPA